MDNPIVVERPVQGELGYNPWSAHQPWNQLKPGPHLDAVMSRHYLGILVFVNGEGDNAFYASQVPPWWIKNWTGAEARFDPIPPYSAAAGSDLTMLTLLLDLAQDYEISTIGGGDEVECRVWFRPSPTPEGDPHERITGAARVTRAEIAQYGNFEKRRPGSAAMLGLAACRALLAAVYEMSDADYERHLGHVRQVVLGEAEAAGG